MKRYLLIVTFIFGVLTSVKAQYYSVNFDTKTVAAMAAAFNTEAATEIVLCRAVSENPQKLSSCRSCCSGIFASKYLDRKALTDMGLWTSSTENYYYRRISIAWFPRRSCLRYGLVAGMMLKETTKCTLIGDLTSIKSVMRQRIYAISLRASLPTAVFPSRILTFSKINQEWHLYLNSLSLVILIGKLSLTTSPNIGEELKQGESQGRH
jgi:hypothetical protein